MVRLTAALAFALAAGAAPAADRVARPALEIERPGRCVEATDLMRRDHMKFLLHQRDRTMREGVRTKQHSLAECVECHASTKTGSVLGEQGFCQSCHSYAGVKLDCFECHAAKRAPAAAKAQP
jgi:hypothetical protein